MLSVQMQRIVMVLWLFDQEGPRASSKYGELKADLPFCKGKKCDNRGRKKKSLTGCLHTFHSKVLSVQIKFVVLFFTVFWFFFFIPPKYVSLSPFYSILLSFFPPIMSSLHTTETFLGVLLSFSLLLCSSFSPSACSVLSCCKFHHPPKSFLMGQIRD